MGQKVHPKGFRLGVIEPWESRWFARPREYADLLHEDLELRKFLKKRLYHAGIARVEIERAANKAKINIYTARPGIVIGKKGAEIEKLKSEIAKLSKRACHPHGCTRGPNPVCRPSWRRGDRAYGVVSRRASSVAHVARGHQLRAGGSEDDLRRDRYQGVGVPR